MQQTIADGLDLGRQIFAPSQVEALVRSPRTTEKSPVGRPSFSQVPLHPIKRRALPFLKSEVALEDDRLRLAAAPCRN